MDFAEAKRQLEFEARERQRAWRHERKCRLAQEAGSPIDEFEEELDNWPWYKELYYASKRIIKDFFQGNYFRVLKSRWQRMRRGYGKQDLWGLDSYLTGWLPSALRELAEVTHGHPAKVYDHDGSLIYKLGDCCDEDEDMGDGGGDLHHLGVDLHHLMWQETLYRMADGFEAKQVLYEHGWMHNTVAEKEMERISREGLQLFIKNFDGLWD